jgi:tetratricopeptide (TPR) repeat protein
MKKGLGLLSRLLKKYRDDGALGDLYWWALYQKATLLLHAGQVKKAESLFHKVRDNAPRESNQLAALHQLGVIELKRRRFDEAETRFLECLRRRLERSKTDFRAAYEYRRLGEVYANIGRLKEAKDAFEKAGKLVADWSFLRYAPELKRAQRA